MAGDELIDVVDADGAVVGRTTRAAMRAGNLRHRTVFVVVVTSADEVVVHQRADWKDVWPSRWDVAFGGVVAAGEAWAEAAARELAEEAGVHVGPGALERLGGGAYEDDHVREVAEIFAVRHDGPFTFPDGEVVAADRVPRVALEAWAGEHVLVPDSAALVVPRLTGG